MSTLRQFLIENSVDNLTNEVVISERLKDFKFKIKALSGKQNSDYNSNCLIIKDRENIKVDTNKLMQTIILNHCVDPNFKDANDIEAAGCTTPEEYLDKCLLAGEQQNLMQAIQDLSGLNKSYKELVKEAKN